MQWIHNFSKLKIPFYTYKLNKKDSIIYGYKKDGYQTLIILHGTIHILKIFTNGELLSIAILDKDNVINIKENSKNPKHYYYKAIAIETTYFISFQWKDLLIEDKIIPIIFNSAIRSYQNTLDRYEQMNHIMSHKYIKHRVIQLILFLCQEFGVVKKKQIIIPFEISQIDISILTGSNTVTINKIINKLCDQMLIKYSTNKKIILKDPLALSYMNKGKYR